VRAGKLDRTIEIQRSTKAVAAAGTVSEAWVTIATLRAELVSLAAIENAAPFGDAEIPALTLRIRYVDAITTADRVIFDGEAFNIRSIVEIRRRRGLELRVERAE
jgi:SPP1 family predicted phage head-tail adaptor